MQIFKRLPHILCIYALVNNTSEFDFVFSREIISCAQRVFTTKNACNNVSVKYKICTSN